MAWSLDRAGIAARAMIVEAKNLGRRFGKIEALTGIDLQVARGEFFGIVGPDGAGKTTLLQMLAAILDPTKGTCRILGFDSVKQANEIVGQIGYMPQGFSLYEHLTVSENLAFSAGIHGIAAATWNPRRDALLAMTGLGPFGNRRAEQLSGGMRKKLALCANLVHEPPLLLLDEPSLGVDPVSRRELWKLLEQFRKNGMTVVLATSYMEEADQCDRLLFLDQGRALAVGTPQALRGRAAGVVNEIRAPELAIVETELRSSASIRSLKRLPDHIRVLMRDAQTKLPALPAQTEVVSAAPTLEDVFAMLEDGHGPEPIAEAIGRPAIDGASWDGAAIRTDALTQKFGSFVALNGVSLSVKPGEVFGFLGPNGSGKTTFIKILCGMLRPTQGAVEVAGIDVRAHARAVRPRIGYMSQRFSLYPDLTVDENLSFFAGAYGHSWASHHAAIAWAKAMAGLGGLEGQFLADVSGAIRQRVALACSIMHRPSVLFLDEPTSGVDPISRQRFWRLIRLLAGTGVTVFVTTHYMEEANYCDRLGLMFNGRLIGIGDLQSLKAGLSSDAPLDTVEDVFLAYIAREHMQSEAIAA